jgi:DNA-binding transcriptional LysR family regulator
MRYIDVVDDRLGAMLLSQVEGFIEIARRGNLSRAAEALHLTQPALTARIQTLEQELGGPLFLRGRRGMQLTDAGRGFLPYAERAMAALSDGAELVVELGRGGTGELVLGAAPAVSTYVLPALLVRFNQRHPNVRLVVRTGHSEEILQMAVRREIAIGLVRDLRHPDIESRLLYEDELVLVAAPGGPVGDDRTVALETIAATRLVLFDRTSSFYEQTNTFFREAGVSPSGVMELDNIDAAKQMVVAGLGVALLPYTAVAGELADGRLRAVHLKGANTIRRRVVAIRRRDEAALAGPAAAFLEILGGIGELLPGSRAGGRATG